MARSAPASASARIGLAVAVVALLVLHVVWPHAGAEPRLFGVLPWDLAYHLLWMAAAAAAIAFATSVVWREPPEPGE